MTKSCVLTCLFFAFSLPTLIVAEEFGDSIQLQLTAQPIDMSNTPLRLLPSEAELVDGNAAVVMLRLIGGENRWMQDVAPAVRELMALAYDDRRIRQDLRFDRMYEGLSRAALMRDANWEYPLNEEGGLLLPDRQSHRYIAGFGLSLWIGNRLADNQPDEAIDGIRTQLACARHIARTPIMVNQLVGVSIASLAIDKLELMVEQPQMPNLYWPLAMLPETVADFQSALQWESQSLRRSLSSLGDSLPAIGDPSWEKVISQFSDLMVSSGAFVDTEAEAMMLRMKLLVTARQQLPTMRFYSEEEIARMSDSELVMRWILLVAQTTNYRIEASSSLEPSLAIASLVEIQRTIDKLKSDLGAPGVPFLATPATAYLSYYKFNRFVKMLQIVEAMRHEMTLNGGVLPESLEKITSVPIPRDPLTGASFLYTQQDGVVTLQAPTVEDLDELMQRSVSKTYRIRLAGALGSKPVTTEPTRPSGDQIAQLVGVVRDDEGKPLQGVRVRIAIPATDMRLIDLASGERQIETTTNPAGEYRFEIPEITKPTLVSMDANNHKANLTVEVDGDQSDLTVPLERIELPANIQTVDVLGMKLTDVTEELSAAYELSDTTGAMILDPWIDSERFQIGVLEKGHCFVTVGQQSVTSVKEFVERLLAEAETQDGDVASVRVVYRFRGREGNTWNTQYMKLTNEDLAQLRELLSKLMNNPG